MHLEKPCEYCWLLMIAKTVNQKYHTKCSNEVMKKRTEQDNLISKE